MKLSVIDLGLKVFKWISRKQYFHVGRAFERGDGVSE